MEINIQALRARLPDSQVLGRYQTVARLLTGDDRADAGAGVAWVYNLRQELGIPPLHSYGFTNGDIPGLVEKAAKASSMKGNPIQLTTKEMELIMERGL